MSNIIEEGIAQLRRANEQANADLNASMQDLRDRVSAGYNVSFPSTTLPPSITDDLQYKRIMLYGSQWNSEVVAAAAIDEDFKKEMGERAQKILQDNGLLPKPDESDTNDDTTAAT